MSEHKNLSESEGLAKLKKLAEDIRVCMFCTQTNQLPVETRPMATQEVDERGNVWFFSSSKSYKNFEIKENEKVQLIYAKPSDSHYLTVSGTANITRDRKMIECTAYNLHHPEVLGKSAFVVKGTESKRKSLCESKSVAPDLGGGYTECKLK
jgi:pyridoxine/pyridoxamine 5'-phosphate oxidase